DGRVPVVLGVPVDGRGAVGEGDLPADLARLQGFPGVPPAVRVVVVIVVVIVVVALRVGGPRAYVGGGRAADALQVLGRGHQPAVLVHDLHRAVVAVQPRQGVVVRAGGQLGGHRTRGTLRLGARLTDQVGPQRQHQGGPGRGQGDRDHQGRAEGGPGPDRTEHPAHGVVSSR